MVAPNAAAASSQSYHGTFVAAPRQAGKISSERERKMATRT
jgi:hypothetical protein